MNKVVYFDVNKMSPAEIAAQMQKVQQEADAAYAERQQLEGEQQPQAAANPQEAELPVDEDVVE